MDIIENVIKAINNLSEIVNAFKTVGNTASSIGYAILAIVAMANCFFGYKLLKLWCTVNGGIVGLIVGIIIGNYLNITKPVYWSQTFMISVLLLLVVIFTYIGFKVYKIGIFFTTSIPPLVILLILTKEALVAIICAIVIGIIAVCISRFVIIIYYAVSYGMLAGVYIVQTFSSTNIGISLFVGAIVSALGIMYQWKTTSIKEDKETEKTNIVQVTSLIRTKDMEEKTDENKQ